MNLRPHLGPRTKSGSELTAVQTLTRLPIAIEPREASGLRRVHRRLFTAAQTSGTANITFSPATQADDPDIRRLLRENPMPGTISISLEREPDYFADANLPGEQKQTIVARKDGRVLCVGSCATRLRFVNGRPVRVGYLGGLRLDASVAGRFDILRRGYKCFHALQAHAPADYYFTSIAADNTRARTFLERGLPGMPGYESIGEYVTLLIPTAQQFPINRTKPRTNVPALTELTGFLEESSQLQFSPHWSVEELAALQSLGLGAEDFCCIREGESIVAAAALWDQRSFKQTVIRGYAPRLARARPAHNLLTRVTGNPRLPAIGETLANAFVSHLAVAVDDKNSLLSLINELSAMARQRHVELLTLGFVANDSRLATIRRNFRCREYRSRLYIVRWPDCGGSADDLDGRTLAPEVALL